jgi:hypothetical protein
LHAAADSAYDFREKSLEAPSALKLKQPQSFGWRITGETKAALSPVASVLLSQNVT